MDEKEIVYSDIEVVETQEEVTVDEILPAIEVVEMESYDIEVSEAFPALTGDTNYNHALLNNREINDAHPISAITGLRAELNAIEALKTVYSDKKGSADYYEWESGTRMSQDAIGRFVTLNKDARTISVCNGNDIFGVTVDSAGFVGGQDDITRDASYGLVVTSGAVLVRCELDVAEGDYVVSNAYGIATKAVSNCGYRVVSLHDIGGVSYATIQLNISADQIDSMGAELQEIGSRMDTAETNIVSAINIANQAYQQASKSSSVSEEAVRKALEAVLMADGAVDTVEKMENILVSTSNTAAQARAIAESASIHAKSMRDEAVAEANEALAETSKLREDFKSMEEGITEVENQISLVVKENSDQGIAIAGIRTEVTDHGSEINDLVSWQGEAKETIARTEHKADANGAYIQSTVSSMDKYSVGPHSQAYGFTLEQAASVLEVGMIYVPTESVTEKYEYTENETTKTYERSFTRGYLYRWGELTDYPCGWITIDKNYSEDKLNASAPAVYFSTKAPSVVGDFGYWYTEGDAVAEGYEPYTLYKWEKPDDEDGYWFAVATLAGNSQNRAVSQIRQDTNSIELRVTNTEGSAATSKQWIDENSANIQDVVSWKSNNGESLVTFMQTADDNYASASQVAQIVDKDGNIKAASIVTAVTEDESSIGMLADNITLDASQIKINGEATFTTTDQEDGTTKINGGNIAAGSIAVAQLSSDAIRSDNYPTDADSNPIIPTADPPFSANGTFLNLEDGAIYSSHFAVKPDGSAYFDGQLSANTVNTINIDASQITSGQITVGQMDLQIGGRNLAYSNTITHSATVNLSTMFSWNITKNGEYLGTQIDSSIFEIGQTYTLSFRFQKTDGTLVNIGGHIGGFTPVSAYINNETVAPSSYGAGAPMTDSNEAHYVIVTAIYNGSSTDNNLYIQPNRGSATSITYNLWDIKVEKGNKATDWTPAPEDAAGGFHISDYAISGGTAPITFDPSGLVDSDPSSSTIGMCREDNHGLPAFWAGEEDSFYDKKFVVDHTGRLFAYGDAHIEGTMTGSRLQIGNVHIDSEGIFADGGCRVHFGESVIYASSIQATGNSTFKGLQGDLIEVSRQLKFGDYPTFRLDYKDSTYETQSVWIDVYSNLDDEGELNFWKTKITNPGERRVLVKSNYKLASQQSVVVQVCYNPIASNVSATHIKEYDVTIPANGSLCTIFIPVYKFVGKDIFKYANVSIKDAPIEFQQSVLKTSGGPMILCSRTLYPEPVYTNAPQPSLGADGYKWNEVWSNTGTIKTSDRNEKNSIETLPSQYEDFFDCLQPVRYKFNQNESNRYHIGFISQDVRDALSESGIPTTDFAGYIAYDKEDGTKGYGLRYSEFIALNTFEIQKLKKRVAELEAKLDAQQND